MDFKTYYLATEQAAIGAGNGAHVISGKVPIGTGGRGGKLTLVTEGGSVSMTVDVYVLDGQSKSALYHTQDFTEAGSITLDMAELPFSHVWVDVPTYSSGNLWGTYQTY